MRVRAARPEDYEAFTALFPELAVDDPTPSRAKWLGDLVPTTLIAEDEAGAVAGYLFYQLLSDTGYIRHVVASPQRRRRGVGALLVQTARERFEAAGAARWCLNVKPENAPAIALYRRAGMEKVHDSTALSAPWASADALPASSLAAHVAAPDEDPAVEAAFGLPRGMIADFRARAGRVILAVSEGGEPRGVAVYDAGFNGSFPFAARSPAVARALLEAMRARAGSDAVASGAVHLVVEADPALTEALVGAGARVKMAFCHYAGDLRGRASSST